MSSKNITRTANSQSGFSLVELLIGMVIVLIILGFVASMINGIQREFNRQLPRMEALNNAEMTIDTIVRNVRMAGAQSPSCTAAFSITPLTPSASAGGGVYNALRVQADWNPPDCSLGGVDENVTFSVKNGIFYIDAAQAEPFTEGIAAIRFKFYDETNTLLTDAVANAVKIKYVEIEIDIRDDTLTTLRSGVQVRSR